MKSNSKVYQFMLDSTVNNHGLIVHVLVAGLFSFLMKKTEVDPELTIYLVMMFAILYEIWQYIGMGSTIKKGFSWTVYRTMLKYIADTTSDVYWAVIVSYWILF